ncbi:MAG: hypothetical protein KAT68_02470 [Bacteroidales bacterium]|nr:hypothetical protein [Bacteroidales bacterium]
MKKKVIIIVEPNLSYQAEFKRLLGEREILSEIEIISPDVSLNNFNGFAEFRDELLKKTLKLIEENKNNMMGVLVDIRLSEAPKGDYSDGITFSKKLKTSFPSIPIINITQYFRGDDINIFSEASLSSDGVLPKQYFAKKDFSKKNFLDIFSKANEKIKTIQKISKESVGNHNNFDNFNINIAIIAALYDDEFESLNEFIENQEDVPGFESLKIAKLRNSDKKVLVDFQSKMGMVEATYLSTQILAHFPIKYLIMIGVCGGRSTKKVKLLDLIIPNKVFDYQTGKYENGIFKPYLRDCNINNKRVISASQKVLKSMEEYINAPSLKAKCKNIKIHSKTLACGNVVVKTDGYLEDVISAFDEETQGVEMESFGVVRSTELLDDKKVNPIIIKSVMDYTEKDKNDNDKPNAAFFSACFTYFLVKDYL